MKTLSNKDRPFTKYLMACWVSSFAAGLAAQGDGQESQFTYQEDLKRLVGVLRQTKVFLGHLDGRGNFTQLAGSQPHEVNAGFSGPEYTLINAPIQPNEPVYEYRSGK